jgi:hypothetical protein
LILILSWFKYDFISKNLENAIDRNNRYHSTDSIGITRYRDYESKERTEREFFIHYRNHSRQLVDALQRWENELKFTSCEYNDGNLETKTPDRIEPEYIPYIRQMKQHLNDAYAGIFPNIIEVETNRKKICGKIQNLMRDVIPHKPSFQSIIRGKIADACLNLTNDKELSLNDTYNEALAYFSMLYSRISPVLSLF